MNTTFTIEVTRDGSNWKASGLGLEATAGRPTDAVSDWIYKMRHVSELDLVHSYAEKDREKCKTSKSN